MFFTSGDVRLSFLDPPITLPMSYVSLIRTWTQSSEQSSTRWHENHFKSWPAFSWNSRFCLFLTHRCGRRAESGDLRRGDRRPRFGIQCSGAAGQGGHRDVEHEPVGGGRKFERCSVVVLFSEGLAERFWSRTERKRAFDHRSSSSLASRS